MISVKGLNRKVNGKQILRNITLEVGDGDVMAIIGPSGGGKTTLLRLINMLDTPDSGTIRICGRDPGAAEARREMAMVFQKPVVFSMSIYDNVAYGLKLRGYAKKEIDARVKDVLSLVDMAGREREYAKHLSGGEAQRIAFARAYVLKPKLLLLDEPTANLDRANVAIIEKAIKNINERYGTTIVLVTHSLYQAKRIANKAAFIIDGELVESGNINDILEKPSDPRTKAFVSGDMVF